METGLEGGGVTMAGENSVPEIELLAGPDADDQEPAELAFRLRRELLDLDVDAVEPAAGQAPEDAKGLGLIAVGALIVRFALRPDVLRAVVSGVRSWAGRQRMCTVKLTLDGDTLEITGPHSAEQERAVDLWIACMPAQGEQGRRLALIVATSDYRDPALRQLRAPGRDAANLARVHGDPAIGSFEVRSFIETPKDQLLRGIARFCAEPGPVT
jgi:hypothetical protein